MNPLAFLARVALLLAGLALVLWLASLPWWAFLVVYTAGVTVWLVVGVKREMRR